MPDCLKNNWVRHCVVGKYYMIFWIELYRKKCLSHPSMSWILWIGNQWKTCSKTSPTRIERWRCVKLRSFDDLFLPFYHFLLLMTLVIHARDDARPWQVITRQWELLDVIHVDVTILVDDGFPLKSKLL